MTHLDEGTIHAWLDGALDEARAAEVGQHAASCAECGARVAEARGFVAGASRILTSLDDVPAGAVPKGGSAVASANPPGSLRSVQARRYWQAAPWVTGIAAALILAIGVKEWRERPSVKAAFIPVPATTADSLRAGESVRLDQRIVDSALRAVRPPVLQPMVAPAAPAPLGPGAARQKAIGEVAATTGAGAGGAGAGGAGARADAASVLGGGKANDLAASSSTDLRKSVVAEAPQRAAAAPEAAAAGAAGIPKQESAAMPSPELRLAGCYRLASVPPPAASAQAKAAAATERAAERRAARLAPTAPAGAAALSAADFTVPSVLRLDTTVVGQGRAVVSAATGEALGTWRAVGGDSVRLLLVYAGAQTLSSPDRIACPETPRSRP